ncbi:MAG: glycosyltransferase family 39 protein [Runella sp.]
MSLLSKLTSSLHKHPSYWLAAILILAFGLRLYKLDAYGIFLDEKYTMVISQGIVMDGANQKDVFLQPTFTPQDFWKPKTLQDFFEANARGDIGNSPVYYAVVYSWMRVFGLSDFQARFPSVIFSVLIVGLMFVIVRRFYQSNTLALLSAFLVAIEPFFVAYSHQARNYSMSFFLTLWATYLFLRIIENENKNQPSTHLYVLYALSVSLSLLSHFLTFTVFVGHGLYVLLFLRKWQGWARLAVAVGVGLIPMILWMTVGAGQWTLSNLEDQAQIYKKVAQTNPTNNPFGEVLPATLANVSQKALPMFGDLFLFSNGLYQLEGKRNTLVAILVGLLLTGLYAFSQRNAFLKRWDWALGFGLVGVSLLFYSQTPLLFGVLSGAVVLFYIMGEGLMKAFPQSRLTWFMLIMALIPNLFLVFWSFRNGHTYGLTQRYGGFSFPYSVTLVSLTLLQLFKTQNKIKYLIYGLLMIQLGAVALVLKSIYEDRSPKYTYFGTPRQPNPYYEAAQKIKQLYEEGDTIKYPTEPKVFLTENARTYLPYSLQDAQLTNLYLPKDARYIQQIDTTELSKIILIKAKNGQKVLLYDLEGKKHRY